MQSQRPSPPSLSELRLPFLRDRLWSAPVDPRYPEKPLAPDAFLGWDHPAFFGNDKPRHIEYCSGNGEWIANRAERDPSSNWVAVERRYDRARKIWGQVQRRKLPNLLVVSGEALHLSEHYFPPGSFSSAFINFPDPWPKRRHAKNRLLTPPFVKALHRCLLPEGSLTFVTDDPTHSDDAVAVLSQGPLFFSPFPAPHYVEHLEGYGTSFFETLWRSRGKAIRYHSFRRALCPSP